MLPQTGELKSFSFFYFSYDHSWFTLGIPCNGFILEVPNRKVSGGRRDTERSYYFSFRNLIKYENRTSVFTLTLYKALGITTVYLCSWQVGLQRPWATLRLPQTTLLAKIISTLHLALLFVPESLYSWCAIPSTLSFSTDYYCYYYHYYYCQVSDLSLCHVDFVLWREMWEMKHSKQQRHLIFKGIWKIHWGRSYFGPHNKFQ